MSILETPLCSDYRSFSIIENRLYLCTSDTQSLLQYLEHKKLDISKADSGLIRQTSYNYFVIFCSEHTERLLRDLISNFIIGEIHFERDGRSFTQHNTHINSYEVVAITTPVHLSTSLQIET